MLWPSGDILMFVPSLFSRPPVRRSPYRQQALETDPNNTHARTCFYMSALTLGNREIESVCPYPAAQSFVLLFVLWWHVKEIIIVLNMFNVSDFLFWLIFYKSIVVFEQIKVNVVEPLPRDRWSMACRAATESHHRVLPLGSIGVTMLHADQKTSDLKAYEISGRVWHA